MHNGASSHSTSESLESVARTGLAVSIVQHDLRQPSGMLGRYAILSGIGASVCELRCLDVFSPELVSRFETDLITWYHSAPHSRRTKEDGAVHSEHPFCLKPLWHHTFMTLTVDLNILELAVGKRALSSLRPRKSMCGPGSHPRIRKDASSMPCICRTWSSPRVWRQSSRSTRPGSFFPPPCVGIAICSTHHAHSRGPMTHSTL